MTPTIRELIREINAKPMTLAPICPHCGFAVSPPAYDAHVAWCAERKAQRPA